MLFRKQVLDKIKAGNVKVAYRRWKSCAVKVGGLQKTSIGVLKFTKVEEVVVQNISLRHARLAGYDSLKELHKDLDFRKEGTIYKINFVFNGEDPRIKLRGKSKLSKQELEELAKRLERLDKYSKFGEWTLKLLKLIEKNEGVGSVKLAEKMKIPQDKLKLNVRKLKNLGLTISLGTGYKISPRGESYLKSVT